MVTKAIRHNVLIEACTFSLPLNLPAAYKLGGLSEVGREQGAVSILPEEHRRRSSEASLCYCTDDTWREFPSHFKLLSSAFFLSTSFDV